ncbi:MAG: tRNA (5-methylaminomethyl-2-thiouridine)(34)-methyltransferase MnmD [Pseudorhodobacter sp.]
MADTGQSMPERAGIDWKDGAVPVSTRFEDPYFSLVDGLAETRHVFLAGNGLPMRLWPGFQVAELGFGTGLNMLATLICSRDVAMRFTSFEAFPLGVEDMARALSAFPEVIAIAAPFLDHWAAGRRSFALGAMQVEVIEGDARETLPRWKGRADAWYLDGFSPARNPELWSAEMMSEVARHTAPDGTCATYSAAGHVRRGLQAAGFQVERKPGHGRKRHMTTGKLIR